MKWKRETKAFKDWDGPLQRCIYISDAGVIAPRSREGVLHYRGGWDFTPAWDGTSRWIDDDLTTAKQKAERMFKLHERAKNSLALLDDAIAYFSNSVKANSSFTRHEHEATLAAFHQIRASGEVLPGLADALRRWVLTGQLREAA